MLCWTIHIFGSGEKQANPRSSAHQCPLWHHRGFVYLGHPFWKGEETSLWASQPQHRHTDGTFKWALFFLSAIYLLLGKRQSLWQPQEMEWPKSSASKDPTGKGGEGRWGGTFQEKRQRLFKFKHVCSQDPGFIFSARLQSLFKIHKAVSGEVPKGVQRFCFNVLFKMFQR